MQENAATKSQPPRVLRSWVRRQQAHGRPSGRLLRSARTRSRAFSTVFYVRLRFLRPLALLLSRAIDPRAKRTQTAVTVRRLW